MPQLNIRSGWQSSPPTLDNAPLTGWAHFRQVPRPSPINIPHLQQGLPRPFPALR